MTTRPFVPRATGEGSIGTSAKHWGNGYFDTIQVGDKDITALDTTGNAATATKLATARTIALSGDATGSATFDGSGDATIAAEVSKIGGTAISDFIKTLLDDGDAATARATLEANAQNCGGIVAASLTDNGYVKFANGLILEWGCVNVSTPYSGIYQDRFTFPVSQRATYVAVGTVNQNTNNSCDVSIYGGTDAVMVQTRVVCTVVVFAVGI